MDRENRQTHDDPGGTVVEEQRASGRVDPPTAASERRFIDVAREVAKVNARALRLLAER